MGHLHLHVGDIEQGLAFYRDVLGFEVQANLGSRRVRVAPAATTTTSASTSGAAAASAPRRSTPSACATGPSSSRTRTRSAPGSTTPRTSTAASSSATRGGPRWPSCRSLRAWRFLWGRERLRVDVLREDVVRIKISRGGVFDETPTFAVVDDGDRGLRGRRHDAAHRRARRSTLDRSARRPPRRRHAGDRVDRALRDAQRRVRGAPPLPRRGRDLRARREDRAPQPQGPRRSRSGTPTSSTRTRRASSAATATRASSSTRTTSRSRSSTTTRRTGRWRRRSSTTATARRYDFTEPDEYAFRFEGGQYTEYVFAGPSMPGIVEAYTWLTGRTAPPPLWALGYHQCRWLDYTQDDVEALGAPPPRARHPVRRALARHRVHGRLPRLHLEHRAVPGRARDARAAARAGLPRDHDHRPGRQVRAGLRGLRPGASSATCCAGPRAATSTSARSGPATPRSRTSSPRTGRRWWGELNAAHVQSGLAGIWNDMNEPATGDDPAGADALRPRPRLARALPQPVRAADGDGHARRPAARRCPSCARSSSRAPGSPASSATPPTGWATTRRAGTTCG